MLLLLLFDVGCLEIHVDIVVAVVHTVAAVVDAAVEISAVACHDVPSENKYI